VSRYKEGGKEVWYDFKVSEPGDRSVYIIVTAFVHGTVAKIYGKHLIK